jgi:hypothetical protein
MPLRSSVALHRRLTRQLPSSSNDRGLPTNWPSSSSLSDVQFSVTKPDQRRFGLQARRVASPLSPLSSLVGRQAVSTSSRRRECLDFITRHASGSRSTIVVDAVCRGVWSVGRSPSRDSTSAENGISTVFQSARAVRLFASQFPPKIRLEIRLFPLALRWRQLRRRCLLQPASRWSAARATTERHCVDQRRR